MPRQYWKGSALLAPLPAVMVTCGTMERANVLTIAWCGIVSTHPPRVYISVRPTRHSYEIIKNSREFVINLTPSSLVEVADYVGTVTGRCVDKVKKTDMELIPSKDVAAPTIADTPLALECKVCEIYPEGTHDMFIADVVGISVDESVINKNGKLCLDRAKLLSFAHGEYYELGRKLGKFGLSVADGKKGKRAVVRRPKSEPVVQPKVQNKK